MLPPDHPLAPDKLYLKANYREGLALGELSDTSPQCFKDCGPVESGRNRHLFNFRTCQHPFVV
jgi:hypothetical protein